MFRINKVLIEPIGNAEPICPNCDAGLPKFPQRKTMCKACGLPIFSRTQPYDGTKRLVTAEQAGLLERQWDNWQMLKSFVAVFYESPLMEAVLYEMESGARGRTSLHPAFMRACIERCAAWQAGGTWEDPPFTPLSPEQIAEFELAVPDA